MAKTQIKVELPPGAVVRICRVVFAASQALRLELHQIDRIVPWEELPNRTRNEIEVAVRGINVGQIKVPAELHARWRDAMWKDGWRYGLIRDNEQRLHPGIVEFSELPPLEQLKYNLFFAMTQTLIFGYAMHAVLEQS